MKIMIHASRSIRWQVLRLPQMMAGLARLGFTPVHTESRTRVSDDPAVLFGTTFFKDVEEADGDWLLVDRASYGDPEYVQLGWNGHLRLGDHKVPVDYRGRPRKHPAPAPLCGGTRRILCGQYQPHADVDLAAWYAQRAPDATHYKPHPAISVASPVAGLEPVFDFDDCGLAITLNSSVAIECLLNGIDVRVDHPSGMAWEYSEGEKTAEELFQWLSWTQWTWDEINAGEPVRHVFEWLKSKGSRSSSGSSKRSKAQSSDAL